MGGGAKQQDIPEIRANSILKLGDCDISNNSSKTSNALQETLPNTLGISSNDIQGNFNNPASASKSFLNSSDLDISNTPSSDATSEAVSKDEDRIETLEVEQAAPIPALEKKPHEEPRGRSAASSSTTSDVSCNDDTSTSSSEVSSKSTSNKSGFSFSRCDDSDNSPSSSSGYFSDSPSRSSSNASSSSASSVFHQLDQERKGKLSVKVVKKNPTNQHV